MSNPYGNPYGHPGGGYPPMMPQQGYPQSSMPYTTSQSYQPTPNIGKKFDFSKFPSMLSLQFCKFERFFAKKIENYRMLQGYICNNGEQCFEK